MVYTKEKTQEIAGAQDGRCFYQRKPICKTKIRRLATPGLVGVTCLTTQSWLVLLL